MPRYHTNSKEVLRDGKHFADCIDDGAARLIADALNERKGMPPVEQPALPLDGADGPLFVGDKVSPRKVNEKLMDHAKEADLRLLTVAELEGMKSRHALDSKTHTDLDTTLPRGITRAFNSNRDSNFDKQQLAERYFDTIRHHVRQENDEYACACGARWDVADGEDHP